MVKTNLQVQKITPEGNTTVHIIPRLSFLIHLHVWDLQQQQKQVTPIQRRASTKL